MHNLFVEQLETKVIFILQEGLTEERISPERAAELADIVLEYLYPKMQEDHLLLARDAFSKIPELQHLSEEIEVYMRESTYARPI